MKTLNNKVILVTGSAKNLGKAIACDAARSGATVALHYNASETDAQNTFKEIQKLTKVGCFKADLTDNVQVKTMMENIKKSLGGIDILVNLIGNFIFQPITETSFEKFKDVIESNLYSTFLCSQYVLPDMQKKKWGRVINFGCVAAENQNIREKTTPYYMAKTSVIMLTKILAFENAKYGITVNSISPGILNTSIAKPKTPTNTFAQFSDVLNVFNFLISDRSHYINGSNIEVAGGWRPGVK